MRSHLTRSVFRRLLSNKPLCQCSQSSVSWRQNAFVTPQGKSFSLFPSRKPAQKRSREAQLVPGFDTMLNLQMNIRIGSRPPPPDDIRQAWEGLFLYKLKHLEPLNNLEAGYALRTYQHCQKVDERRRAGDKHVLSTLNLKHGIKALAKMSPDVSQAHAELAEELFEEIKLRIKDEPPEHLVQYLQIYISILSKTGNSAKARDFVMPDLLEVEDKPISIQESWLAIMKGFAKEGNREELLNTFHTQASSKLLAVPLIQFYAEINNVAETKKWYSYVEEAMKEEENRHYHFKKDVLTAVLNFSIRNNEQQWCSNVFRKVIEDKPTRTQWDVIFQWAAGSVGKGVEDVEHMIQVMTRVSKEDGEAMEPTMETINGLVSMAMSKKDPYLAERYIALGQKLGLRPDSGTYILQMDYRIAAGDLTGASAAYESLQGEEILHDLDIPVMNKYIRALCSTTSPDYHLITSILDDLDQREARLDPDTVAALCPLYLERSEADPYVLTAPMVDLLQAQSFKYTLEERSTVIDACVKYILNPETHTALAYYCHEVFVTIFSETRIEQRVLIMREFFRRRRSDMALYVFGYMRQHDDKEVRPVLSTYVDCFEGIALCHDAKTLREVHNMLKLDTSIEPNTALYNSLMLAYTECGDPSKAMHFWDDITLSREGPDYRSLEVVFRACAKKSFGAVKAKEIWAKMRRMDIEVTRDVFIAYIGALGGNSLVDDAKGLVERGETDFGHKPDLMMVGNLYNAIRGQERKNMLEAWAKDLYPEIWAELEKLGQKEMREGYRMFKLPGIELKDDTDEFEEDEDGDVDN